MNKIILEKLIYKNYLKTALTSILFIEIVLIIIYFVANQNIVNTSINFILDDIKKSIYTNVDNITSLTEHRFEDIENLGRILQNEHQNFFKYNFKIKNPKNLVFKYAKNGMYYKLNDNGGSSVVVSKNTKITEEVESRLINSELFDDTFKSIVNNDEIIISAYFNSYDNTVRYYPFIKDIYNTFPSDIKMEDYDFYTKANLKNNPKKEVLWTDIYLDPAGQGWMLSVITPIYNNNFLEGVTGIDLTVDSIIDNFLNFKLPYNGSSFLIDKNGKIIAMSKEIENILNIKNNVKSKYPKNQKIEKTIYNNKEKSLLEYPNENFVNKLKNIVKDLDYSHEVIINDKKHLLFSEKIEKTSWYLISLIDENQVLSKVRNFEDYNKKLGYIIILLIVMFYIGFFLYLYLKAKSFVVTINTPILKIIEMTKSLGSNKNYEKLESCGIVELDTLSDNFNNLANELEERTNKLIESETRRISNEKLANTDALTNVFNRRYLEDFFASYIKILKREKKEFALLIVDIDDFKKINDSFGHDVGDFILKRLVNIIKDIIRENDIVVRLGGDEFVILLPNSNIQNARIIGSKIIDIINTTNKLEKEFKFSISIGVSEYLKSDFNIETILKRADKSLYKAKDSGKNCIK